MRNLRWMYLNSSDTGTVGVVSCVFAAVCAVVLLTNQ